MTPLNDWIYLCLTRDVKEGDHWPIDVFGHSVVVRHQSGEFTVSKNACAHRGFKVCQSYDRNENVTKCPYHGLPFNFGNNYQFKIVGEMIFFHPDFSNRDFEAITTPKLGEEIGGRVTTVQAPFHLWVQNTADTHHVKHVHKDTFNDLIDVDKVEDVKLFDKGSSYRIPVGNDAVEKWGKYGITDEFFRHFLYYPHLSITSFLGIFHSIETATPQRNGTTEVHTRFFLREGLDLPGLLKRLAIQNNFKILDEDQELIETWAESYTGLGSKWLPNEDRIKHFVNYLQREGLCKST